MVGVVGPVGGELGAAVEVELEGGGGWEEREGAGGVDFEGVRGGEEFRVWKFVIRDEGRGAPGPGGLQRPMVSPSAEPTRVPIVRSWRAEAARASIDAGLSVGRGILTVINSCSWLPDAQGGLWDLIAFVRV